ncbi:MAG: DUF2156 domain-containing protein [Clostridia bacterium]|nr:DUF2156 domain-containing protein [Clostridia bacterium]
MLEEAFHALSIEDKKMYDTYHALSGSPLSDMCFNSRIAWDPGFGYRIGRVRDTLCMVSDGGVFTSPHLAVPLGRYDADGLAAILGDLRPDFESRGWEMRILYVDEGRLPLFQALETRGYHVETCCDRDFSDYLYDGTSMRTLSGKALHAKRNHMNRFLRDYPDYTYAAVTAEDGPECLSNVRMWCEEKGTDPLDLTASDYVPIQRIFEHFDRLDVHGGVIRVGGRVRAFALGSRLEDGTAVIHFEKADAAFNGLYVAINNAVLCGEFPDAPRVNREEDMGIEGLRKAKQSYMPVAMADKHMIIVRPAG